MQVNEETEGAKHMQARGEESWFCELSFPGKRAERQDYVLAPSSNPAEGLFGEQQEGRQFARSQQPDWPEDRSFSLSRKQQADGSESPGITSPSLYRSPV